MILKFPDGRFSEAEILPVRIELGPKDLKQIRPSARGAREKQIVALDALETEVAKVLETMQKEMLERARAHRNSHLYTAVNYDEFKEHSCQ